MATRIPIESLSEAFAGLVELSSEALGATIVSCSDEFFAPAADLLRVYPAPSLKGQFGPNGALFSGWETRRHNTGEDWCAPACSLP
jgi:allantoicase